MKVDVHKMMWMVLASLLLVACGGGNPPVVEEEEPETTEEVAEEATDEEAMDEEVMEDGAMEATTYKIGFISAVTGASFLGVPERNSAEMLAAQIEEAGGVMGPDGVMHPVEFIFLDSETNPDTAAAAAARLIDEDEVDILIAGSTSGNSLAMVPLATEAEVPMIAMGSAGAIVADPESGAVREWIFKAPHNNFQVSTAMLTYLEHLGAESVCHLYENSGYGQDTLNQLTTVLGEAGVEIAYSDSFERGDTEFPQMVSVQGAGCDVVTIGSISPGLVTAAVIDSIPDQTIVQFSGSCDQALLIDASAGAAEGNVLPCTPMFAGASLPDNSPNKSASVKFIADYEAATGELPNQFAGIAYDSVQWAVEALETLDSGMDIDARRAAIRDAIEGNIKNWAGVSGTFTMTPDDHLGLNVESAFVYVRVEDGQFVYYPQEAWTGVTAETAEVGSTYKIGFISAVTGASFLGVPERNSAEMIQAQLEEAGGILGADGKIHPVEFIMFDSETNPDTAAAAAARLIDEDEVDILIAGSTSGNSLAMVPLATEAEVPMIAMGSAGAIVADPESGAVREWIFKAPHNNFQVSTAMLAYLEHIGAESVCHLYENSGYGQDTLNQLTAVLDEAGITLAYSDSFERGDTEFPQMVSIQGAGCDVVTIGSIAPGLVTAGVIDSIPDQTIVQFSGSCDQALLIEASAGAAEGNVLPCTPMFAGESLPDSSPNKSSVVTFLADYEAATGELPNQFAGIAFDSVQWALHALKGLDDSMSLAERRASVRDAIESGVSNWAGVSGTFNMTAEDHLGLDIDTAFVYVIVEDGAFVYYPPSDWE